MTVEGAMKHVLSFGTPAVAGSHAVIVLATLTSDSTLADVANAIGDWAETTLAPQMQDSYTVLAIDSTDFAADFHSVIDTTGGRSGEAASPSTSVLVRKSSGQIGRQNRGRTYFPGLLLDSEVGDDGSISSGVVDTLQGIMDGLVTALAGVGTTTLAIANGTYTHAIEVSSYQVESTIATQRRRLRK